MTKKNGWIKLSEKLQELIQCDVVYITIWDENTQKKAMPLLRLQIYMITILIIPISQIKKKPDAKRIRKW